MRLPFWAWVVGLAFANPKVIELQVPEPTKAPPPPPPPSAPPPAPGAEDLLPAPENLGTPESSGSRPQASRAARSGSREVKGEAPTALWGRYVVVQVTKGGETEDFRIKMDREGRALKQDCITDQMIFDFGGGETELPGTLALAEQQLCNKGGFGTYGNELGIEMPANWLVSEGTLKLSLPPVEATSRLVRVRPPSKSDDLNTPSHWAGPLTKMEQPKADFTVVAEFAKKPKPSRTGEVERVRPSVVHLVGKDFVYHLEPEPEAGLFSYPDAAHPEGTGQPG